MNGKAIKLILITLTLLGIFISGYLIYHDYRISILKPTEKSVCSISDFIDCDKTSQSSYALIFGIPTAAYGLFFYIYALILMLLMFSKNKDKQKASNAFLFFIMGLAILYSIFLGSIQLFIIKAICLFCFSTYIITSIIFILSKLTIRSTIKEIIKMNLAIFKKKGLSIAQLFLIFIISLILTIPFPIAFRNHFQALADESIEADLKLEASTNTNTAESYEEKVAKEFYKLPKDKIILTNSFYLGDKDGSVTIAVYSDFVCPHCKSKAIILENILKILNKGIKLYFKNYPLDQACLVEMKRQLHEHACLAAKYAYCAGVQNKFWPFHDLLFKNNKNISPSTLPGYITELSIDLPMVNKCIKEKADPVIMKDIQEAKDLNINATPTIFVNGRNVSKSFNNKQLYHLLTYLIKKETGISNFPAWNDVEFEITKGDY
ncbi:MAG: vitamin K epoxide reductase family protein [Pseudomonadota bacterium]